MSSTSTHGLPAPSESPSRRSLLQWVTYLSGAVISAALGIPAALFVGHPLRRRTVIGGEEPVRVAREADVVAGAPRRVDVVTTRRDGWLREENVKLGACWLVRDEGGGLRALSTVCPHLGCGVDWEEKEQAFSCACHGSKFDRAGRRTAGPSPRDMDPLEVKTENGDVKVAYRRFRLSTGKREPLG